MKYEVGDLLLQTNIKNNENAYLVIQLLSEADIGFEAKAYKVLEIATGETKVYYSYYVEDNNWSKLNAD